MMHRERHPLEPLILSRGLRRACLYLDTACALHRLTLTGNQGEIDALTDEQLLMALILTRATPDNPAWADFERRLGRPLPKKVSKYG